MKAIAIAIGIAGAIIMSVAGVDMMRIKTEAGAEGAPTIMEVFYNAVGMGFLGLGIFCIMLICIVGLRGGRGVGSGSSDGEDEEDDDSGEEESDGEVSAAEAGDSRSRLDRWLIDEHKKPS